jgi:hypothetical protein
MSAPTPTAAARKRGRGRPGTLAAAALVALLVATPLLATVWTRSTFTVRLPKNGPAELENASYSSRDWSVALTQLEVRLDGPSVGGIVTAVWSFRYTNTDTEPHYVSLNVKCLDSGRNERTRFVAKATLQADRPDGARVEIPTKMRESDWDHSAWAKIVADFLSGPNG